MAACSLLLGVASAPGSCAAQATRADYAKESHAAAAFGSQALFPGAILATADLSLFKVDSADPVSTRSSFSYTVTVANDGPDAATDVDVTDTHPAGVAPLSATPSQGSCIPPAATITCHLGTRGIRFGDGGHHRHGARDNRTDHELGDRDYDATDPDPSNNAASEDTTIVDPGADLASPSSTEPDPAATSAPLTYTLLVSNAGPDGATGVTVTDTLPAA